MPIMLKTGRDLVAMRQASQVAAHVAAAMSAATAARPGVTTAELDALAAREIDRAGAISAILHRGGRDNPGGPFPAHTCISVNDQVLNGVPGPRVLRDGDIVSFDVSVTLAGWCGSRAIMVAIGAIAPEKQRLIDAANASLASAIAMIQPMRKWSAIARQIQQTAEAAGFQIVREFTGHGIGRELFEQPMVFNHVDAATLRHDFPLRAGMTLTVEPILVAGRRDVVQFDDGWTVATADGHPGAHVRHTIAVTQSGAEVLTGGG